LVGFISVSMVVFILLALFSSLICKCTKILDYYDTEILIMGVNNHDNFLVEFFGFYVILSPKYTDNFVGWNKATSYKNKVQGTHAVVKGNPNCAANK